MTPSSDFDSQPAPEGPEASLAQIEQLCAEARDGRISPDAALRRIARLARQDTGGPIYQKPLG